ncbi:MAG: hypothetical protein WD645_00100 [Dehalococcoidia bacterium]
MLHANHIEPTAGRPTSRAALTNDPLGLPPGLSRSSAAGRRWRDLAEAYSAQLGPELMQREDVRLLVGNLISFSMLAERQRARIARDEEVDVNQFIQLNQTIRGLLDRLSLSSAPRSEEPGLANYLSERTEP